MRMNSIDAWRAAAGRKHGLTREPTTKVTTASEDWHSGKDGRDEPEVAAQIAQEKTGALRRLEECNREDIRTWQS